jgi:hypothetical protein
MKSVWLKHQALGRSWGGRGRGWGAGGEMTQTMYAHVKKWIFKKNTPSWSTIQSSNPTPGDIPKRMWLRLLQRHMHTHVYCSTIHNSQVMETAKMPHHW